MILPILASFGIIAIAYMVGYNCGKEDAGNAIIVVDEMTDMGLTFTMYDQQYTMTEEEFKAYMLEAMRYTHE